jgi:endonuclease/exonuclease/phosphatase family metal-dependent hydrolase
VTRRRFLFVLAACAVGPAGCATAPPLRVMTFNVRYGTADDGANAWPERRERLFAVIDAAHPDVLGLQEALRFQLDELRARFPGFGEIGVGRDDGRTAGEYAAILYRTDRLAVDSSGTFWLSDTPEVPGSVSWGNHVTRICTWALIHDRTTGVRFAAFNLHLDHESQPAREHGAELVMRRMADIAGVRPVVLTGDFNAGEDNPAVTTVLHAGLRDTFRALHPDARWVGTFDGFSGDSTGPKIDYVFAGPRWEIVDAAIVRSRPGGRDASDHFPVTAVLRPAP